MFTKIYVNIVSNADPFREKTYSGISEMVIDRQVVDTHSNKGYKGRMATQYEQEVGDDFNEVWLSACVFCVCNCYLKEQASHCFMANITLHIKS